MASKKTLVRKDTDVDRSISFLSLSERALFTVRLAFTLKTAFFFLAMEHIKALNHMEEHMMPQFTGLNLRQHFSELGYSTDYTLLYPGGESINL